MAKGTPTTHELCRLVFDINTKSMTVAEEGVTLVGSDTTWDRWKSLRVLLSGERLTLASILKSPQIVKLARLVGRRHDKTLCSFTNTEINWLQTLR